ncbi:MAG: M28 family peptidase [Rhodothermales bacterium]|nr:M28 family peptidase [Rhodothermales bacterium]
MRALLLIFSALLVMPAQAQDRAPMAEPAKTPSADQAPDLVRTYQDSITPNDLAAHLYYIASDDFEGRETSTRGQKMAAAYLASQYRRMGLAPAGTAATEDARSPSAYLQPFPLYGTRQTGSTVSVKDGPSSTFSAADRDGHSVLVFGNAPETTADVVFGGYGIADSGLGYDDYAAMSEAGIEYQTSWLMILADEPLADAETSLLDTEDGGPSRWSGGVNTKLRHLFQTGLPAGVLLVGDSSPLAERSVAELADAEAAGLGGVGSLSLDPPSGEGRSTPPMLVISTELANAILAPSGRTVAQVQAEIAEGLKPVVFEVEGAEVSATVEREAYETTSENVIAFIEGSDPNLKDEVVVVSSHYDHVGMTGNPPGEDQVYNGADDDGSGTVAVLEIAEAFSRAREAGHGPRRSIAFLNVSGEEKGLLGSRYYTDTEPVFALENTVANLNIDMIGRVDPTHPGDSDDYVYIIGSNLISQELHDTNVRMNTLLGTNLDLNERFNSIDDPNRFYRRSDHWNFGKHEIPFIFFFTGTHEDYHGADDEPDKIEYERLARISQLIFGTAWQLANQDDRPAVSGAGFN